MTNDDSRKVSVVMSVYNGARFLRESIESILSQSFPDFELIIVNDASKDESENIIKSYQDPRIILIENEKNLGLTQSLNKGFGLSLGKYIARQDADDISLPDRFARQVEFLDRHPDVGVVGTAYQMIDEWNKPLHDIYPPLVSEKIRQQLLLICNPFAHGSVMLRRSHIQRVGFYHPDLPCSQDYELWLRFIEKFAMANLPEILYQWRMTLESISVKKKIIQERCAALAIRWYYERQKNGIEMTKVNHRALTAGVTDKHMALRGYHLWGYYFIMNRNFPEAMAIFRKAWRLTPFSFVIWISLLLAIGGPLIPRRMMRWIVNLRQRRMANQFKIFKRGQ